MSITGPQVARHAIGRVAPPAANATPVEKLRGTAQQLQSVFVEQLFKAMRSTVPDDGVFSGGQGEEMFRGLLDQHMSEIVPTRWTGDHSLGEIMVRQLSQALRQTPAAPASAQEE
jgi:flagellar protein FlgJ